MGDLHLSPWQEGGIEREPVFWLVISTSPRPHRMMVQTPVAKGQLVRCCRPRPGQNLMAKRDPNVGRFGLRQQSLLASWMRPSRRLDHQDPLERRTPFRGQAAPGRCRCQRSTSPRQIMAAGAQGCPLDAEIDRRDDPVGNRWRTGLLALTQSGLPKLVPLVGRLGAHLRGQLRPSIDGLLAHLAPAAVGSAAIAADRRP